MIRAIEIKQFMAFDTGEISSDNLKIIKENLADDKNTYMGIEESNGTNLKIIKNLENEECVFLAFDTTRQFDSDCVSLLCIRTKDENIRNTNREDRIINDILRQRYFV